MADLCAVQVSLPGMELPLLVRPFGGWFVVTEDGGPVADNTLAYFDDPADAEDWARNYLYEREAESIANHPSTGNPPKVDLLRDWHPEDDE